MGSSRQTAARIVSFLGDAARHGIGEALKALNLSRLAGRPIEEVFTGLVDYFCPEGGGLDKDIARDAFMQTVGDVAEQGVTDLNNLNFDQIQAVLEIFMTHAIELRLYNEIGTKAITLPTDTAAINNVQAQLHDFVANGVADALGELGGGLPTLAQDQVPAFLDSVFENAFIVLAAMGDAQEHG
jgi:hypothetical protein